MRVNVATWDEVFLEMATVVAKRSKDPSCQVGACIVSSDNKILSLGYNGTPHGWSDESFPWGKVADSVVNTKYPYVIHAERNAVLNYNGVNKDFRGATAYITHFPCNDCAKELVQIGVKRIVYLNYHEMPGGLNAATLRIFKECGVKCEQFTA